MKKEEVKVYTMLTFIWLVIKAVQLNKYPPEQAIANIATIILTYTALVFLITLSGLK